MLFFNLINTFSILVNKTELMEVTCEVPEKIILF